MPEDTIQVAFRLPVSLVEKVDAYAAGMNVEHPGMSATRADAARVLITRGLIAVGLLDAPKAAVPAPKSGAEGVKPVSRKGGSSPRKAK